MLRLYRNTKLISSVNRNTMLKFFLILFLIAYCIYKVGGFLFKSFFVQQQAQRPFEETTHRQKPADGNVYVENPPKRSPKKDKQFDGGEYVDYEEVD